MPNDVKDVTWKEYTDLAICVERELRKAQFVEMQRALDLARLSLEKRLDGMNEFREALKDQTSKAVMRTEYELAHGVLCDAIRKMELSQAEREGRTKNVAIVSSIIASIVCGILITLLSHWIMKP